MYVDIWGQHSSNFAHIFERSHNKRIRQTISQSEGQTFALNQQHQAS